MKKILSILIVAVVIVGGYFLLNKPANQTGESIKVGALLPLTGFAANYGDESKQGIEMAEEDLKDEFPNLPNIEIFYEDSFYNSKGAVDGYQKMTAANKIDAVLAGGSQVAIPVKPLSEKDNVLEIAIWSGAPSYSSTHNLNYRTTILPDQNTPLIIDYLSENKLNKLAILYAENEFGIAYKESLEKLAPNKGVQIISSEGFPTDANDFRTALTKIKATDAPAVFYVGAVSQLAKILNQEKELNLNVKFLSQGAAEDQQLIDVAGKNAEGLVYVYTFDYETPSAKKFTDNHYNKYKRWPSQYVAESYMGLWLIGEAVNACDNKTNKTDVSCWKNYLDNFKNQPTIMGQASIDDKGDLKAGEVFLKTVKDGKFVKLEN